MSSRIYPLRVTLNGQSGVTLWAPHWRDNDGEQWTGFLGTDDHVYLFETDDDLLRWLDQAERSGLDDHPDWQTLRSRLTTSDLTGADRTDLDAMFDAFVQQPSQGNCDDVSHSVQFAQALAGACDDAPLLAVLGRRAYEDLASLDVAGGWLPDQSSWHKWGTEVAESWGWVLDRVATYAEFVPDGGSTRGPVKATAGPWRTGNPPPQEVITLNPLPSRAATILFTALLGVLGAFPAAVASAEAKRLQQPTSRYWQAFGVVLMIQVVLVLVVIGVVIANS